MQNVDRGEYRRACSVQHGSRMRGQRRRETAIQSKVSASILGDTLRTRSLTRDVTRLKPTSGHVFAIPQLVRRGGTPLVLDRISSHRPSIAPPIVRPFPATLKSRLSTRQQRRVCV